MNALSIAMKFKLRPIFKDIALTFITQAIVLAAFFFVYRLIAQNFGPKGVGEYSLVKRMIGFTQSILLLGLGVGIPRYIAMSRDKKQRSGYIRAGGFVVVIFAFISLLCMNLLKDYCAKTFFGNIDYAYLILPFSFFAAGLILHSLVYAYFRGRLFVKTFNSLQIINLALVPLIILVFFEEITIEKLITLMGATTLIISLLFSLFFVKEFFIHIEKQQLKNSLKELLCYGLPRVPGDFALAGLFSLGPIFAAHFASIQEVGYLSISQSLLNMVAIVIVPVSTILLPKIGSVIINGREEAIRETVDFLIGAVLQCFIFVTLQLLILADVIINYWLGPGFSAAVPVMRIVFTSITFYVLYVAVRSVLDAVKVKPLNAINLFVSLGIFLLGTWILLFFDLFSPIISLSIAFTSGIMCLGLLTYVSIRRIYPGIIKKDLSYLMSAIVISVLLGGIAMLGKSFISHKFYHLIAFEVLLGVIYLSILWLLRIDWIRQIPEKIIL